MARRRYYKKSSASGIIGVVIAIIVLAMMAKCGNSGSDKKTQIKATAVWHTSTPTITQEPTLTPTNTITPTITSTICRDPSCGCVIKGNINSEGKKIYHCPNSPNYDDIRLNKSGERYFCTEEDAIAAGFELTGNTDHCGGL